MQCEVLCRVLQLNPFKMWRWDFFVIDAGLQIRVCTRKLFFLFPTKTYVVGTQKNRLEGTQWLSGRVLDSRLKDRGFGPHLRHCVVSLSKNI